MPLWNCPVPFLGSTSFAPCAVWPVWARAAASSTALRHTGHSAIVASPLADCAERLLRISPASRFGDDRHRPPQDDAARKIDERMGDPSAVLVAGPQPHGPRRDAAEPQVEVELHHEADPSVDNLGEPAHPLASPFSFQNPFPCDPSTLAGSPWSIFHRASYVSISPPSIQTIMSAHTC